VKAVGAKKLLVLGATENQLPLIRSARAAGLYVVVCDWTTTNPGIAFANRHHQVSTMDLDAVMKVAVAERVDGCVTNSEPALMNATLVAERLGLPGNPSKAVDVLTSKVGFRELQERAGLFAPRHARCDSVDELIARAKEINGPFVVKPVRSSGSRGTTVCGAFDEAKVRAAHKACTDYSRDGLCSVEEYVPMPSLQVVDGDIFLYDGEIIWDGLFLSVRSSKAPLVPMTQIYPPPISDARMERVKRDVAAVLLASGVTMGQYNIEAYFTDRDELFIIEINARQGGNRIPARVREYSGIDLDRLLVTTAVGEDSYWREVLAADRHYRTMTFHQLFSRQDGVLDGYSVSNEVRPYLVRNEEEVKVGSPVKKCVNAEGVISFACFDFPNADIQGRYSFNMEDYIYPIVRSE